MQDALKENRTPSLLFCLVMDSIGMLSYVIPGVGEISDLIWAPISAYVFLRSFGGMTGKIGALVNLIEEAMPGTDIIPTFTIGYIYVNYFLSKKS